MSTINWTNTPNADTQQIRIVTVDPATSRVEGVIKDGAMIQVAVWDAPLTFRWPEEGETWSIRRQGVFWFLDSLVEDPKDTKSNADLAPGEAKIGASQVYNREGERLVAIDPDLVTPGTTPIWVDDHWETTVLPTGATAPREFIQALATNPWVIHHNLGRYPVGLQVFDTYGVKVEADVIQTDLNTTTITFSGAMSGTATYA